MQKVAKSFEKIAEQYKNLGKGFTFKGSAGEIQKQIDKYTNSLEAAKLKKEELEVAGKTEGKMYEAAVAKTIEYTNVVESLKQQLADVQSAQPQLNFNISGLEETRQTIEAVGESIRESVSIPESANYNKSAMIATFGEAAGSIENWAQAVEQSGKRAGQVMNDSSEKVVRSWKEAVALLEKPSQLNIDTGRIQETEKDLGKFSEQIQNTKDLILQTFSDLKSGDIFKELSRSVGNYAENARTAIGKTVSSSTAGIKKIVSGIKGAISKTSSLANSLIGVESASKGMTASFSGGFKTMLKYAFGIRSLFTLFNKLRNAIKEGMKNLVQYSNETNTSVSMLTSSIATLKNASAAAISPLLNAIAPALNQLIQLFIRATNAVNQFFSALTGRSTWIKAKDQIVDYAESVSGAAKAAKGALQPFDKLNNLTSQQAAGGGADVGDMFETLPIDDKFKDLVDWLKDMWDKADFYDLGKLLGEKLKEALDSITWDKIKSTARKLGKSLATLLNGFIEVDGLGYSIGRTFCRGNKYWI